MDYCIELSLKFYFRGNDLISILDILSHLHTFSFSLSLNKLKSKLCIINIAIIGNYKRTYNIGTSTIFRISRKSF